MDITKTVKAVQAKLGIDVDGAAGADTWGAIYARLVGPFAETRDVPTLILFVQQSLGLQQTSTGNEDTWAAIASALAVTPPDSTPATPVPGGQLDNSPADERSEGIIKTLLPGVQPYARTLVHKAAAAGITIKLLSGLRTYEEQDKLYAQGRTAPGDIVTNAKAGHSNHNFGLAFDIGVFEGTHYLDESPKYTTVGAIGAAIGLDWGGNWATIRDEPHFELRPQWAANLSESNMLAALRERKDEGKDFLA